MSENKLYFCDELNNVLSCFHDRIMSCCSGQIGPVYYEGYRGQKIDWDKFKESAGLATGGAAVAGGGLFLAKNLGWLKKVPKCGWIYSGIIGAAAATAAIFGSK